MQCYVCHREGRSSPAVGLCRVCSIGLCLAHLREAASRLGPGGTLYACAHHAWQAGPYDRRQ
ncbi:MAG: hypothetical protein C4305_07940 [Thermoleophilia bacterium]